jgi:hypothetical protein
VVPIAIDGAFEAMPRGRMLPRKGKIRITFLKPVKAGRLSHDAFAAHVRELVRKKLEKK